MNFFSQILVLGLISLGMTLHAAAQSTVTAGVSMTPEQTRQSVQWLAEQLLLHVPRRIEGDDDWGDTKKVWAGVKVHREGWELKTNRRWRELRHGRWIRYEIQLPPQSTENAMVSKSPVAIEQVVADTGTITPTSTPSNTIQIHSVSPVTSPDGVKAWRADASLSTPASFSVRVERWNLGVQWFSIEISGKMNLSMRTELTMGLAADFAEVPPAMQLEVNIEKSALTITRFEVERISKLGGDVAEEIGDVAENTIGKVWIRKENAKLSERLNKAIHENRDSLRWSMADWLAQLAG
jgi:hypothetical protein